METESRLPIIVFASLVVLILLPVGWWQVREMLRPKLVEARIVTATDHDPVFRDGPRRVPAGHRVEVAIALGIDRALRGSTWLAPVGRLELDGGPAEHVETSTWPVKSRELRVFWFTVEGSNVGGELTEDTAASKIRYRNYFAPEMGGGLLAETYPEAHADDALGPSPETTPEGSGTLRFYARIEVIDPEHGVQPLQAVSTRAADGLPGDDFPAVHRSLSLPEGIDPVVGELFLLPGFEPLADPPEAWNDVTRPGLGRGFTELVEHRLLVSSLTFAAVAASGSPELEPGRLDPLGRVVWADGAVSRRGGPVRWGNGVRPGDLMAAGSHWIVLAADDGDGVLGGGDEVLHCWRRPAGKTILSEAIDDGVTELELQRRVR